MGHGAAAQEAFLARVVGAGVAQVVDIRTAPGSRRYPHFGREALARWLPAAGVGYRWERRLGGFRKVAPDSPDVVWRNASFRGYAGWTRHPDFLAALDEVLETATARRTCVMCSESLWWRCHRRIVADAALLLRGAVVDHLLPDGGLSRHEPTPGVRVRDDGLLVYDQHPEPGATS